MPERSVWERVQEEFACGHPTTEARKLICSNGAVQWVRQCPRCGHNCGALKKEAVSGLERLQGKEFDHPLRDGWQARMQARMEEVRTQDSEAWWASYNDYLLSPEWRKKREAILRRDMGICRGCLTQPATQVHHLTYERTGREMAFDLVAVCDRCHSRLHEK